jgi:hypothetical protein
MRHRRKVFVALASLVFLTLLVATSGTNTMRSNDSAHRYGILQGAAGRLATGYTHIQIDDFELAKPGTTYVVRYSNLNVSRWGYDLIQYTSNAGPCSLIAWMPGDATDSTASDTLVVPFGGLNLGAQGSFLPGLNMRPWCPDSIYIAVEDTLDYLRVEAWGDSM